MFVGSKSQETTKQVKVRNPWRPLHLSGDAICEVSCGFAKTKILTIVDNQFYRVTHAGQRKDE